MYWYKDFCEEQGAKSAEATKRSSRFGYAMKLQTITALIFIAFLSACKPDSKETGEKLTYFDLKGYFKTDSAKLAKANKLVLKTVVHNKITETKRVHIDNWGNELRLFSSSDINKPAWKDSYAMQNTTNTLIYTAQDSTLETKRIIINKDGDKVKWILIFNHTKNLLYETKEKLTYIPDSMYRIEKTQKVRLLGLNRYDIKGMLNQ